MVLNKISKNLKATNEHVPRFDLLSPEVQQDSGRYRSHEERRKY